MIPIEKNFTLQNNTHQPKADFGEPIPSRRLLAEKKKGNYKKAGAVAALTMFALSIPATIYKNSFSVDPQNPSDLKKPTNSQKNDRVPPDTVPSPVPPKDVTPQDSIPSGTIPEPVPTPSPSPSPSIEEQSYTIYMIGGTILLGTLLCIGIIKKCMGKSKNSPDSPTSKEPVKPTKTTTVVPVTPKSPVGTPSNSNKELKRENNASLNFTDPTKKPIDTPTSTPIPIPIPTSNEPKISPTPLKQPGSANPPEKPKLSQATPTLERLPTPTVKPTQSPQPVPQLEKKPVPQLEKPDPKNFNGQGFNPGALAAKFLDVKSGLRRVDGTLDTPRPSFLESQQPTYKVELNTLATNPFKQFTGKMEPRECERIGPNLQELLRKYEKDQFSTDFKQFNETFWAVIKNGDYKFHICAGITKDQIASIVEETMKDVLKNYTKYSNEPKDQRIVNLERLVLVLSHTNDNKDLQDKYLELAKCGHDKFNFDELERYAAIAGTKIETLKSNRQTAVQKFNEEWSKKVEENKKKFDSPPVSPQKLPYSQRHPTKVVVPQQQKEKDIIERKWKDEELKEFIARTLKISENHSDSFLSMDPSSLDRFAKFLVQSNDAKKNLEHYWQIEKREITSNFEIAARNQRLRVILPLLSDELMKYTASLESFWCLISKSEQGYPKTILDTFVFNDQESEEKELKKLKKIVSGMFKGNFKNRILFLLKLIEGSQNDKVSEQETFKKLNALEKELEKQKTKLKHQADVTKILDNFSVDNLETSKKPLDEIVSTVSKGEFKKRISSFCALIEDAINSPASGEEKAKKLNTIKVELEKQKKKLIDEEVNSKFNTLTAHYNTISDALKRHLKPVQSKQCSLALSLNK